MKSYRSQILILIALVGWFVLPVPVFANVIADGLAYILWALVVTILGTALGLAGLLFDFSINTFVIGFGTMYEESGVGFAVDRTWVVIRDFVNMAFIFGLVYIGMKMILGTDTSNTRRWLVNLLIAALLINFSLFFTKFVVDVSNQFATAIASQGFQERAGGGIDVSGALMDKLGVSTVFSKSTETDPSGRQYEFGYIFGTALILIIATFVFAAGAILLIIRFAMLNLFLVFSPVLFLSFVLPPLQNISRDYWKKFLSKAFFAPLYLLFIYVSFTILDAMSQSNAIQDNNLGGIFDSNGRALVANANNDQSFPFFIMASVLLIGSLVISQRLGVEGASKAVSMGKDLSKKAGRFANRNTTGVALRGVGAGAKGIERQYQRLDARVEKLSPGMRRTIRGAAAVSTLGLATNRNVSAALKGAQNLSVSGSDSYEKRQKDDTQTRIRRNQTIDEMNREKQMEDFNEQINQTAQTAQELNDAFGGLGKLVKQMTNEERANLGFEKLSSSRIAMHLSDAHIEALEKSGDFSNQEIQKIRNARNQAYVSVANGGIHPIADVNHPDYDANKAEEFSQFNVLLDGRTLQNPMELQNFQNSQREAAVNRDVKVAGNMEVGVFTSPQMAQHLTPHVLEERMKNGGIRNDQLETIRNNIQGWVNGGLALNTPDAVRRKNMWESWTQRSSYGARVGLSFNAVSATTTTPPQGQPAPTANPQPTGPTPTPAGSPVITPGTSAWNAANQNLPPRPGPQP